jgi:hypothetical protein
MPYLLHVFAESRNGANTLLDLVADTDETLDLELEVLESVRQERLAPGRIRIHDRPENDELTGEAVKLASTEVVHLLVVHDLTRGVEETKKLKCRGTPGRERQVNLLSHSCDANDGMAHRQHVEWGAAGVFDLVECLKSDL